MLSVTNLSGLSEPITNYYGYEKKEEVNGGLELSFTSIFDEHNPGHELIAEESIIEDNGYEFRVKQLSESQFHKQVTALSTYFDLVGTLKDGIFGGTRTFSEFAEWVFSGTGWTVENVDVTDMRFLPNFGDANIVTLTNQLTATFECEYQILPNNVILFAKQVGHDYDAQYRYRSNIKTLSKQVDTTNLRTRIKGIGGNGLTVTYTSPNAATFGIRDAETVNDDSFTSAESLTELIKRELIDYPEISIEVEAIELQQTEIGERVWLIYEPLKIEFQTRVLSRVSRIPESRSSVTLGNSIPRNLSDILASTKIEIDLNKKESRSRIEQTNEKILLEVGRVDGDIVEAQASIVLLAESITSSVESNTAYTNEQIQEANEYAAQEALDAKNEANGYTDEALFPIVSRVTESESSIVQLADSISSKVETIVYDQGILDSQTYASLKAKEAEAAAKVYIDLENEAAQISLEAYADGIVNAEEQARIDDVQARLLEAKNHANTVATSARQAAEDHANGLVGPVVERVTTAESSIIQLNNAISFKAETSVTDWLGQRTTTAEQNIDGLQGAISQKVSVVDYNGNAIVSMLNQSATTFDIIGSKINLVGAVAVLSDIAGNLGSITAGTIIGTSIRGGEFILNGGTLDLRLGTILWGSQNTPMATYAENAGNANKLNGSYTAGDFSLSGHQHLDTQYVIPYTGQSLRLWRSGTKVRVYQGSAWTEFTGVTGSG